MKKCLKCGLEKSEDNFWKDKKSKDGFRYWCKDCDKEYLKEYHKKSSHRKYLKEYRKTIKYKERQKRYQQTDKSKEYARKYVAKKRINNPKFKLDRNIGTMICISLNGKKDSKSWESLVGYTIEDLIKHLEKQFEPWMSWENWGKGIGKWNIDHIKPKSLFHYTSPEDKEFKECWSLSNLQPMEAIANIKKNNKYGL